MSFASDRIEIMLRGLDVEQEKEQLARFVGAMGARPSKTARFAAWLFCPS